MLGHLQAADAVVRTILEEQKAAVVAEQKETPAAEQTASLIDAVAEAVAAAVCVMGLAGEIGVANMAEGEGNSSLRNRIIDAIYNMDANMLNKGAKYEVR